MIHKTVITRLYHLLVNADSSVNEKELRLGKQMARIEGISESEFALQQKLLETRNNSELYSECLADLKRLDRKHQIRCIAWMCVIANSDGFMDKAEWQFIYKIYHKELHIPLSEIMKVQNELIKLTHQQSSGTLPMSHA